MDKGYAYKVMIILWPTKYKMMYYFLSVISLSQEQNTSDQEGEEIEILWNNA